MKTALQPANVTEVNHYTCRLSQADGRSDVGAKARTLGRMMNLGILVPAGFVTLDGALQEFLTRNDLLTRIKRLRESVDIKSPASLQSISQEIRTLVLNGKIPPHIDEEIAFFRQEMLGDAILIVRSSAVGEDSAEASFAGQLDSFLNVKSPEDLHTALLSCWASYWSERSLFYQLSRCVHLRGMGVIFQKMIFPIVSGVLFTTNPDAAGNEQGDLLVEYCHGHAEPLVSGKVNPGRLTISRSDFGWRHHFAPEQPPDWRVEQILFRGGILSSLARLGLRLEKELGCPQDIEWVIDASGNLFLVQSRPITTQPGIRSTSSHSLQTDAEISAPRNVVVWSNANVNENFPDPISPLLYSIASAGYYYYFRNLAIAFGIARRRVNAMEHRVVEL